MKRGRPHRSEVRQRMEKIVDGLGVGYGYQIYKIYRAAYEKATMRNIYYHLKTGIALGVFVEIEPEEAAGNYTWGSKVERKRYLLGPNSTQKTDLRTEDAIKKLGFSHKNPDAVVGWERVTKEVWGTFQERLASGGTSPRERRSLMEEYGRIRAWLGKNDQPALREEIDKKLEEIK